MSFNGASVTSSLFFLLVVLSLWQSLMVWSFQQFPTKMSSFPTLLSSNQDGCSFQGSRRKNIRLHVLKDVSSTTATNSVDDDDDDEDSPTSSPSTQAVYLERGSADEDDDTSCMPPYARDRQTTKHIFAISDSTGVTAKSTIQKCAS